MFHRRVAFLPSMVFLVVVIFVTEETLASVSEEYTESASHESYSTGSTEETSEVDSSSLEDTASTSTLYTTTGVTIDNESHEEEPKLPVDLLSEDILLDPNIVLARLARDSDSRASNSEYLYRRPLRRTQEDGGDIYTDEESRRRDYLPRKLPIYPVFPGKK